LVAFGVALVLVLVEDVCANATPATREAAAAAIVKLFGSFVISDLLLQCESTVAMGCPLQRSAVICRCAKRLGRVWAGKRRSRFLHEPDADLSRP